MPSRTRAAATAVLLAPLLTLALLPGSAHAEPKAADPERVTATQAPAPQTPTARTGTAERVAPASIDSDVYAYTVSTSGRTYFTAAGHLRLTLKKGSTTKYSGSFVDHVGGASTKASADTTRADAPTISIKARNGDFAFRGDSSFGNAYFSAKATKAPSRLKAGDVYLSAVTHVVRTATYTVVVSQRTGPINRPTEYNGTMTLAYDGNNRVSGGQVTVTNRKGKVVTTPITNTGYYSGSYFYAAVKVDTISMGLSGTISGTTLSGFGVAGSGSKTTQWAVSGTA